jgi:phosphocarrier protein FPr/phosphocarrier protein
MILDIKSPLTGWLSGLNDVPDATFSEKMLGDGLAIDPLCSFLISPIDGEIIAVAPTCHSVTIRSKEGAEILIHVGIDTVTLNGLGFKKHVTLGQSIKTGDKLLEFDLSIIATKSKSLITPIILINEENWTLQWKKSESSVQYGDKIMTFESKVEAFKKTDQSEYMISDTIILGLPHGIHARPAGRIASLLKDYKASLKIIFDGHHANARSPTQLMSLGATKGAILKLFSEGDDADKVISLISQFLSDETSEKTDHKQSIDDISSTVSPYSSLTDLKGIAASPGLVFGRATTWIRPPILVSENADSPKIEKQIFNHALLKLRRELEESSKKPGITSDIFNAHLAFLDDPELIDEVLKIIDSGKSAGYAWKICLERQITILKKLTDLRLAGRARDLEDLCRKGMLAMGGIISQDKLHTFDSDTILITDELLPSEIIGLSQSIKGLITSEGGATSHVAIIANSIGLPYVAGLGKVTESIADAVPLILNGDTGSITLDPSTETIESVFEQISTLNLIKSKELSKALEPCHTKDGLKISILANLGGIDDVCHAMKFGAEGCGLLRSEFLFIDRNTPPSEEEQYQAYQKITDELHHQPLVIRTLDIGGDKQVPYLKLPPEENPALGLRGIRTSLWNLELLRTQIRAILRISPIESISIMLPMIVEFQELDFTKSILIEEASQMGVRQLPELGVMIETPAAAITSQILAEKAEFFSIGTNDLTQYTLAMDRTNRDVAARLDALHPAVINLISQTCQGAKLKNRSVGVCGGLASEKIAASLLIGLGVTKLSVSASSIPSIKSLIRSYSVTDCQRLAEHVLTLTNVQNIRKILNSFSKGEGL